MLEQKLANILRDKSIDVGRLPWRAPALDRSRDSSEIVNLVRHHSRDQRFEEVTIRWITNMPGRSVLMQIRMNLTARLSVHSTPLPAKQVDQVITILTGCSCD